MSKEFLKYRVRCTTEGAWKCWILPSTDPAPTTCPTDTAHTLNTALTSVEDIITEEKVTVREESIETGGNFQTRSVNITSAANTENSQIVSWPYAVSAMAIEFVIPSGFEGDQIALSIGENTIVGIITSDFPSVTAWTSSNYTNGQVVSFTHPVHGLRYYTCILDTVSNEDPTDNTYWMHGIRINVSSTVIEHIQVGFYVNLTDGVNNDDCGRVLLKETETSRIYLETPPSNTYLVASPTYVRQTAYYLKDWYLGGAGSYHIGESKIGGSYVPADTIVKAYYKNNSGSGDPKTFYGAVEYLY